MAACGVRQKTATQIGLTRVRLEYRGEEFPEPFKRLLGRLEDVSNTPTNRENDVTIQTRIEQPLFACEAAIDRRSLQLQRQFEITNRHIIDAIPPEKVRSARHDFIIFKLAGPAHLTKIAGATKLGE